MTIIDVAKEAGVSKSTVSLVLNNSPLVKDSTRSLVQKTMQQMGYIPDVNARGLITHKSMNFGVLEVTELPSSGPCDFAHETGLFATSIINGILQGLADTDYGLITEKWTVDSRTLPRLLQKKCIDGLFVIGTVFDNKLFKEIEKTGLKVVVVGRAVEGVSSIYADPGEGAVLCMKYLYEHGHRHVCFINAPSSFASSAMREKSLLSLFDSMHVPEADRHMIHSSHNSGEGGYLAMEALEASGIPFDGIAVANDIMAMGVLRYCYQKKLRLPDDVSIVAYDDSFLCAYASPALTAVDIHKELSGKLAAKEMLKETAKPAQIIVPLTMIERDSVRSR